jgi:glycosyltransferase involved in cell wall biosynthesis
VSELTIVIPTIGRARLADAIASLREQSNQDFEFIVGTDAARVGAGSTRNRLVRSVKTPWTGFLDDDDVLRPDYVEFFYADRGDADVLIFKMDHPTMGILPRVPVVEWSNVGISFAAKTSLLREVPFFNEDEREGEYANEDFAMLKELEDRGALIEFSDYVGYEVRGRWRWRCS